MGQGRLEGKVVALAVTGSIAAYKAVEVARLLIKEGARVLPVLTQSATKFVGPVTFAGITGESVAVDMWDPTFRGEMHVALAQKADALIIVPATADVLARMAGGRADDLVTALALVAKGPVLAAPAMHPRMWSHPAVKRNVATLTEDGRVQLVGPVAGPVASGEEGMGRMVEPEVIVETLVHALAPKDLSGLRIVVTAGPTVEDIDPVRFLGNRSTGKTGFAVARRAAARGADAHLITGPVSLPTPMGARRTDVRSALAMREALWRAAGTDLDGFDALVMTSAVADYRPRETSLTKVKKAGEEAELALVRNPDLLAELGHARSGQTPFLVGFAVETGDDQALTDYARKKLAAKKVDLVVANEAHSAFGGDDNRALLVDANAVVALPTVTKDVLADHILDRIVARTRS